MIISCPNCGRKYSVDDSKLKPKKKLRCVACESVWAHMSDDESLIAEHFVKESGDEATNENMDINSQETEKNPDNEFRAKDNAIQDESDNADENVSLKQSQPKVSAPVKQKKSSSVGLSVALLILLLVGCGFGWYFKDLILSESRKVYEGNILKNIFGVIAKAEELPKIEDLSTNIKGGKLLVKGVVANRTNIKTKYKFLRVSITPKFGDVLQLAIKNPSKLMEVREIYYIKLDKKVLERNEKVDFSTNLDLFGVRHALLRMELCNLE